MPVQELRGWGAPVCFVERECLPLGQVDPSFAMSPRVGRSVCGNHRGMQSVDWSRH